MQAHAEGRRIEFRFRRNSMLGPWGDIINPEWTDDHDYRPKPEPKLRPWSKPEDVPSPVCWIRQPHTAPFATLILSIGADIVRFANHEGFRVVTFSSGDLAGYEYSTDRIHWHPCGIVEEQP